MVQNPSETVQTQSQTQEEVKKLLDQLENPNSQIRCEAWQMLGRIFQTCSDPISDTLLFLLQRLWAKEEKDDPWRAAAQTVLWAFMAGREQRSQSRLPVAGLGTWLWDAFNDPSWVLRVADPDRLRRDEDAVIEVARSLSLAEFPLTEFICVDPEGFDPRVYDIKDIKAFCFVGRLCLFGDEAVKAWSIEKERGFFRYRFATPFRPPELPLGELHPEYHAVVERKDNSGGEKWHRTVQDGKTRTDYGLIQRYVVSRGEQERVVVHIAGCSSLGTQAAAHYAAHTLLQGGPNKHILPLPPKEMTGKNCLEALSEAKADIKGSEYGWRLRDLKLLDLRIDGFTWDKKKRCWNQPARQVKSITLGFADPAARQNYRKHDDSSIEVLFDGQGANFRLGSENRRLCITLCLLAESRDDPVRLQQLADETWIWGEPEQKSVGYVRNRLANISEPFHDSVTIEGGTCKVSSKICIDVPQPKRPR